jgi:hypothetical protein
VNGYDFINYRDLRVYVKIDGHGEGDAKSAPLFLHFFYQLIAMEFICQKNSILKF